MALCTLLTDWGLRDYYVGAVRGTLLRLAPETTLVDITHDVAAGDVEAAAFVLAAASPAFPRGTVHLAVVDPGVGSSRRILVAEAERQTYVAPDNGLLTPLLGAAVVRAVERQDLYLPTVGHTFHGRDRFAPVAASLLRGERAAALGPAVDDALRLAMESPTRAPGHLRGTVIHVDRFGNLVTNIPSCWLQGKVRRARVGGLEARRWASYYAELPPGEPGLLPGSLGTIELALRDANLARTAGVGRGERVSVEVEVRDNPLR